MKIVIAGILLVCNLIVVGQIDLNSLMQLDYNQLEDNCFVTHLDTSNVLKDSIYLAIIPPQFEIQEIPLILQERPLQSNIKVEYDTSTFVFVEQSDFYEWVLQPKNINDSCTAFGQSIQGQDLIFCLFERPIKKKSYQVIKINSPINPNAVHKDTIMLTQKTKVKDGEIRIFKNKPKLAPYPIIQIPNGKWSDFEMVFCTKIEEQHLILEIQHKLNVKGYPVEMTGIFDRQTRGTIMKYLRSINCCMHCRIGECDILQALGIKKY